MFKQGRYSVEVLILVPTKSKEWEGYNKEMIIWVEEVKS